jgi:hypothetical protein
MSSHYAHWSVVTQSLACALRSEPKTYYLLELVKLIDLCRTLFFRSFVAGQDMTKSDAKVISPEILSAVTGNRSNTLSNN